MMQTYFAKTTDWFYSYDSRFYILSVYLHSTPLHYTPLHLLLLFLFFFFFSSSAYFPVSPWRLYNFVRDVVCVVTCNYLLLKPFVVLSFRIQFSHFFFFLLFSFNFLIIFIFPMIVSYYLMNCYYCRPMNFDCYCFAVVWCHSVYSIINKVHVVLVVIVHDFHWLA